MNKTKTTEIILAGFGGQGVLFAGKLVAYAGLLAEKEVSWLPSYGPEMKGGTANCSVIVSDTKIGSPIILKPNILIALNLPSLGKFEDDVIPGGIMLIDSSLIDRKTARTDAEAHYIPATRLADESGLKGLANMVMVGKLIRESGAIGYDFTLSAMKKCVPERKKDLLEMNLKAIDLGYNFK